MIRFKCPWCGERNMVEFSYGGDAVNQHPGLSDDVSLERYIDYVYLRTNPCGPHFEYWQHINGCRQWLKIQRDTLTHEVLSVLPAGQQHDGEQS